MPAPAPANFEAVLDDAFAALLARFSRSRLFLVPPVLLLLVAALLDEGSGWRRWVLGGALAAIAGPAVWHVRRLRRVGLSRRGVATLVPLPITVLTVTVLVSGGIDSPLFMVFAVVCVFLAVFLELRLAVAVGGLAVSLVVGLSVLAAHGAPASMLPEAFGGGPGLTSNVMLLAFRAAVYGFAISWGVVVGTMLRGAYREAIEHALSARDEVLRLHADSARTLTTLSAEIAHELKNPLASVKGLSQLLARDATGKDQERLVVLRREVDRMQEILESFLTYSRPLLPLAAEEVVLGDVARHVLALHEGVARERQVTLALDEERPVSVRADARKLTQVLVNLVQNALDASVEGGAVELVVRPDGGGARVEVRDRGPGVPEGERERVFDAGVTTKATGHGLGLTVARAIARQHGGELALSGRVGGGAVAVLTLPAQPQEAA